MNVESNISIVEILSNRKYLTNQAKKIAFDNLEFAPQCKSLIEYLSSCTDPDISSISPFDLAAFEEEITPKFEFFMRSIEGTAEQIRIRNRLSKSKSKKSQKTEKQPKIDDATLFQLNGFALQLGEQKGEKVSIDQALKFLLEHAVKTIRFS